MGLKDVVGSSWSVVRQVVSCQLAGGSETRKQPKRAFLALGFAFARRGLSRSFARPEPSRLRRQLGERLAQDDRSRSLAINQHFVVRVAGAFDDDGAELHDHVLLGERALQPELED